MQARRRFHDTDESVALIAHGHQQQQHQQHSAASPLASASSTTLVLDVDDATEKYAPHPNGAAASAGTGSHWSAALSGGLSRVSGLLPKQLLHAPAAVYAPLQQQLSQAVAPGVRYLLDSAAAAEPTSSRYASNEAHTDDHDDVDAEPEHELEVMASRDRTAEFGQACRQLQSRNVARTVNVRDARKAAQLQSHAEFMQIAKHVGRNIASTYAKLEKLTLCEYRDDR